ncbi:MAG: hypothetical protein HZB53_10630 [Chloroflexi bacterium]|nr:hypothetical protein [Chloroflexota bacterium]
MFSVACAAPAPTGAAVDLPVATRIPRTVLAPTPTATARPPRSLPPNTVAVDISDSFFQPGVITVTVGTTVRWYHDGGTAHNVRAVDGSWAAPDMHRGDMFARRFDELGAYNYLCLFHAGTMFGSVIVVKP